MLGCTQYWRGTFDLILKQTRLALGLFSRSVVVITSVNGPIINTQHSALLETEAVIRRAVPRADSIAPVA